MIDALYKFLASVGMNEPLHPPITHMPIGLITGAIIFFVVALFFKRPNLVLTARHVSILAFIFAFPTILLGVLDWIHFYHAALVTPIIIKIILASVVLVVLGTGIILGSEIKVKSFAMLVVYSVAFVCAIGLGYFGSGVIYGRGMEQKPKTVKKAVVRKAAAPAVPVAGQIGIDEKLGAAIPQDLVFSDETGRGIALKELLAGPVLLSFVTYTCPNSCNLLLTGIAHAIRPMAERGKDLPRLVTVSLSPSETAADARRAKQIAFESIERPFPESNWRFLTGSGEAVGRLTSAAGFRYVKSGHDYEHPLGLIVLSGTGTIVRYIPGGEFLPVDLSMALMEASKGIVRPTVAKVFRMCFSYDPGGRRLVFRVLRVSATLVFLLVGGLAVYLLLAARRRRRGEAGR